uniref:Uncharacterized protein n=1 Tax=Oryzias melastigma TaxID=30732 RepID=A0A3B3C771_ORYME
MDTRLVCSRRRLTPALTPKQPQKSVVNPYESWLGTNGYFQVYLQHSSNSCRTDIKAHVHRTAMLIQLAFHFYFIPNNSCSSKPPITLPKMRFHKSLKKTFF